MTADNRSARRRFGWTAALVLALVAGWVGFQLTHTLGPTRLEAELRGWLENATGAPVKMSRIRLVLGVPAEIEAQQLVLWEGALTVQKAAMRIDPVSLLLGFPRITRLRLDGADLSVANLPGGGRSVGLPSEVSADATGTSDEPLLAPLRAIESVVRTLLSEPLLADTLIVRRSHVRFALEPGSERTATDFFRVDGRLLHSRIFRDARLFLRVSPGAPDGSMGTLEWTGTRDPEGALNLVMAASGVDLSLAAPYLKSIRSQARVSGKVDGIAEFTTTTIGEGTLLVDAAARDFTAAFPASDFRRAETWRTQKVETRFTLNLTPQEVEFKKAQFNTGELKFGFDARIARPVQNRSRTRVALNVQDLDIDTETLHTLTSWLDPEFRDRVRSVTDRVTSGRFDRARFAGVAPLKRWRAVFDGGLSPLPAGFRVDFGVSDLSIRVDPTNRISNLFGGFSYADDTFTATDVRALLNGEPLPELALTFSGLSRLLASPVEPPETQANASELVGLTPLFETFRPEEPSTDGLPMAIGFEIDRLQHPALIWPLEGGRIHFAIRSGVDRLRVELGRCQWAGLKLDGAVDFTFRPDRRIAAHLTASDAGSEGHATETFSTTNHEAWLVGDLTLGPTTGARWRHREVKAHLAVTNADLALTDVVIAMDPVGEISGDIRLDLAREDYVAFVTHNLRVADADLSFVTEHLGGNRDALSGTLAVDASLRGTLLPGKPILHDSDGKLALNARDGEIQRAVPVLAALAGAGESLNPFSNRETIRYRTVRSQMILNGGSLETDALDVDGPDLRLFASGSVDLSHSPYPLDAEIALFLFRQFDWAVGKIPILNALLLDDHENLVAAYFEFMGSWKKPEAKAKPLKTLQRGPVDILTKGIPRVVRQGMEAIGDVLPAPAPEAKPPDAANLAPGSTP